MTLDIQFKIKTDPNYQKYIREHSNWYKILNRNPEAFPVFEEEVKEVYKLKPSHRITKMLDNLEMVSALMSNLK